MPDFEGCLLCPAPLTVTVNSLWKPDTLTKHSGGTHCYLCRIPWGTHPWESSLFRSSLPTAHLEQRVWPLQPGRTQWSNWTEAAPEMYAGEQRTRGQEQSVGCLAKRAHRQFLIQVVSPDCWLSAVWLGRTAREPRNSLTILRKSGDSNFCKAESTV